MNIALHPAATAEFSFAAAFYEAQREGLGLAFVAAVDEALAFISAHPAAAAIVAGAPTYRRAMVRRFPYAIYYAVEADVLRVYAVAHQKRRPGYWRERAGR